MSNQINSKTVTRTKREPHPEFLKYMMFIACHNNYKGMPDAFWDDGRIQWEAPSNRSAGKYKNTHHKRREWWRQKAEEIGVDTTSSNWISQTAKIIHPTKKKPCKVCGKVMDIRYAYPTKGLISRIRKLPYVASDFEFWQAEHVTELVVRLFEAYGDQVLCDLIEILKTSKIFPPNFGADLSKWIEWIEIYYIPLEPATLSPGAMANPPDRFDGFHSFNLCCRSKADTGRHLDNLRSYTTDRRVFEYWSDGDWIASDRLMGMIRSKFRNESCLNNHPGPCNADHIGPISLGFTHRPEFQLLCTKCNSAKNNRMTLEDVRHLIEAEAMGEKVVSGYAEALWDSRKFCVVNDETALRLSKLLRDNRHTFTSILYKLMQKGHYLFLLSFLGLNYASFDVEFSNLRVENHRTKFDQILHIPRDTKYSNEQKVRRSRIAFTYLRSYVEKVNRNSYIVSTPQIENHINELLASLNHSTQNSYGFNKQLTEIFTHTEEEFVDTKLREVLGELQLIDFHHFRQEKNILIKITHLVADELSGLWEDDRYIRSSFEFETINVE